MRRIFLPQIIAVDRIFFIPPIYYLVFTRYLVQHLGYFILMPLEQVHSVQIEYQCEIFEDSLFMVLVVHLPHHESPPLWGAEFLIAYFFERLSAFWQILEDLFVSLGPHIYQWDPKLPEYFLFLVGVIAVFPLFHRSVLYC